MFRKTTIRGFKNTLVLFASVISLSACGGDGSSSSADGLAEELFSVSGSVSGLNGEAVLGFAEQSETLSSNGSFSVSDVVSEGEGLDLSLLSDPFGQSCEIISPASFENVTSNVTNVLIECSDVNVVSASVQNFFTGDSVAATSVTLSQVDGGEIISQSVVTDDTGVAMFEVPLSSGRVTVSVDPQGFSEQSVILEAPAEAAVLDASLLVQPVMLSMSFSGQDGGDLVIGNDALVTLPAAAFVTPTGETVTGDIAVELTVIDPSQDASLMPGDYTAQDPATMEVTQIESFGALNVTFEDAVGGDVQLADGMSATLRIPVAAGANNPPDTIPLYFFDDETGFWVEEGMAALTTLASGAVVYEGAVSHFSTWNADIAFEAIEITGCVVDLDGNPASGVSILSSGTDYIGTSSTTTNSDGVYSIAVRPNSDVAISASGDAISATAEIVSGSENETIGGDLTDPNNCLVIGGTASASIELTWGENPSDLDANFFAVPAEQSDENFPFQVSFRDTSVIANGFATFLDRDDVSSFGPEVITTQAFPYAGTYTYGVHLFSGSSTIQASPARVELNLAGDVTIFSPPAGTPTECWAVLEMIVDDANNVTVNELAEWAPESFCTSGEGVFTPSAVPGGTKPSEQSTKINPLEKALFGKYYAE